MMSKQSDIPVIEADYDGTRVNLATPPRDVGTYVAQGGLALLKGAFPVDLLQNILDGVFAWGQQCAPQRESSVSFHRIDERPQQSRTPHTFHAYNFLLHPGAIDAKIDTLIRPIFSAMRDLQNAVAGTNAGFEPDAESRFLQPQVIQYPSGGGFFGEHVHPLEPQRVGLIVGLSEKGRDFKNGGTCFRVGGRNYSFEDTHSMGDIILFRYDVPHWITPIDDEEHLDWTRRAGRWTMVLPLLPGQKVTG
ncbi:MAG: hypothetical protein CL573_05500 [Alphaproteobacteria bacterium]|nr:hypothetical protein [Alphaproteobacteria bacterium]HCO99892.1 hypothetical protein [Rhodospirillaceae bacterium]|tara:strand:- start:176 stop:919 length:744 start_codon:yes stop_codon:yes gene_type:complete